MSALKSFFSTYWHCPHSMWRRVYDTVESPSVCPSVCPINRPQHQQRRWRVCCWAPHGQEISIDSRAGAQQQMRAVSCWQPRDETKNTLVTEVLLSTHLFTHTLRLCVCYCRHHKTCIKSSSSASHVGWISLKVVNRFQQSFENDHVLY